MNWSIKLLLISIFASCYLFLEAQTSCPANVSACLIQNNLVTPTHDCCPIANPEISDCNSIEKYMARSLSLQSLSSLNSFIHNNGCNAPCQPNCNLSGYCPDLYCKGIKSAIDLKASHLRRVVQFWDAANNYAVGSEGMNKARQAVIDINAAYDCAGLRRPIIQATICEFVGSNINAIPIPSDVHLAFSQDPEYISDNISTYTHFQLDKMDYSSMWGGNRFLDISRVLTRMWVYYVGKQFIDMGYTNLELDAIYPALSETPSKDPGNIKTKVLLDLLRDYANASPTGPGFVLLNAEIPDLYFNHTNELILDFTSSSVQPTENAAPNYSNCNLPANMNENTSLLGDNLGGGISPTGCDIEQIPFHLIFDNAGGEVANYGDHSVPSSSVYDVYGYDDATWMSLLNDECLAAWLSDNLCRLRSFNSHAFLQIPGLQVVGVYPSALFNLQDRPLTYNALITLMAPKDPLITITSHCKENGKTGLCEDGTDPDFCDFWKKGDRYYEVLVDPQDCFSEYSIEVVDPNGHVVQTYTNGLKYQLFPLLDGNYTVRVKQDNWGINNVLGSKVFEKGVAATTKSCCYEALFPTRCDCCPNGLVYDGYNCRFGPIPDGYIGVVISGEFGVRQNFAVSTQSDGCPTGYHYNGKYCTSGTMVPDGFVGFISGTSFYVEPNCGDTRDCCPPGWQYDGYNCFSGVRFPEGYSASIWNNAFYLTPIAPNTCPDGFFFDGVNCVSNFYIPSYTTGFIHDRGLYVKAYCQDESDCCPLGSTPVGNNCFFGSSPAGWYGGFVHGNGFYVMPGLHGTCPNGYVKDRYGCFSGITFPNNFNAFNSVNQDGSVNFYVEKECPQASDNCCPPNAVVNNISGNEYCWFGDVPTGYSGFVYGNMFYVSPNCALSSANDCCPVGYKFDGANCASQQYFISGESGYIINGSMLSSTSCTGFASDSEEDRNGNGIEIGANIDLAVVPNPFSQFLNVQFNTSIDKKLQIVLVNTMGQILQNITLNDVKDDSVLTLNTREYGPGEYFIQIKGNNTDKTFVIVKAN